jgi:L-amino acid N-acyltransferase YncA
MAVESAPTTIEVLRAEHWAGLARVYEEGIATRNATFETELPAWEEWDSSHLAEHRFVALRDGEVVGWAAASPLSSRCCYRGVVESSVYVAASARGQGVGRRVLEALIASTEAAGIWTIEAGMFPENEGSVRLHEAVGFETVGTHKRLGKLDGVWRDVLLLERRSESVD